MPMTNRYPLQKTLAVLALYLTGFVAGIIALACLYAYGREIVLSIGASDKSLLFWYLPILFIGGLAFWVAALCGWAGYRLSRKLKE